MAVLHSQQLVEGIVLSNYKNTLMAIKTIGINARMYVRSQRLSRWRGLLLWQMRLLAATAECRCVIETISVLTPKNLESPLSSEILAAAGGQP